MIKGFIQLLILLPKIISIIKECIQFFEAKFGENWPDVIARIDTDFKKLKEAKSVEERLDVARSLHTLITKL